MPWWPECRCPAQLALGGAGRRHCAIYSVGGLGCGGCYRSLPAICRVGMDGGEGVSGQLPWMWRVAVFDEMVARAS